MTLRRKSELEPSWVQHLIVRRSVHVSLTHSKHRRSQDCKVVTKYNQLGRCSVRCPLKFDGLLLAENFLVCFENIFTKPDLPCRGQLRWEAIMLCCEKCFCPRGTDERLPQSDSSWLSRTCGPLTHPSRPRGSRRRYRRGRSLQQSS